MEFSRVTCPGGNYSSAVMRINNAEWCLLPPPSPLLRDDACPVARLRCSSLRFEQRVSISLIWYFDASAASSAPHVASLRVLLGRHHAQRQRVQHKPCRSARKRRHVGREDAPFA